MEATGQIAAPPLFAKLRSAEGGVYVILADGSQPVELPLADVWDCEVLAPSGSEAVGQLERGQIRENGLYKSLSLLFSDRNLARLWFAPVRPDKVSAAALAGVTDLPVSAWDNDGKPLPPDRISIGPRADTPWLSWGDQDREAVRHIETIDGESRPTFAAFSATDMLMYDARLDDDARLRLTPRLASRPGLYTAYWSFLRLGRKDAAKTVAVRLLETIKREENPAREAVIASAHAIVRFQQLMSHSEAVLKRLSEDLSLFDARIMQWVLRYEMGATAEIVTEQFNGLLRSLSTETIIFAETFRLLDDRFAPAQALCFHVKSVVDADAVRYFEKLSDSTYLGGEHLVFTGSSPHLPDPEPTASGASRQKKNLADQIRQSLSDGAAQLTEKTTPSSQNSASSQSPAVSAPSRSPETGNATLAVPAAPSLVAPNPAAALKYPKERAHPAPQAPAVSPRAAPIPAPAPKRTREQSRPAPKTRPAPPLFAPIPAAAVKRPRERRDREPVDSKFVDRLVHINRVAKVVKGGRRFGFSALVVVGDQKGRVGFGHGKAREVPEAIRKATESAQRSLIRVPLREGRTLHHDVNGRHGAGRVILRAAPAGTGIIAGGPMRAIFETLGMHDVVAKSQGSSNPYNMIRATFDALKNEDSPRSVAARRNIKVSTLQSRRIGSDVELGADA